MNLHILRIIESAVSLEAAHIEQTTCIFATKECFTIAAISLHAFYRGRKTSPVFRYGVDIVKGH